jgi:hypothetical protein
VFLANFEATIANILKQTRNHPCIVEWTGGNEMPWRNGTRHPALQILERLVRELDGRMFRATEPAQGSGAHGTYTYVYHTEPAPYLSWLGAGGQNLYRRYDTSQEMRISEFGTNSPANLEVWQREIPSSSQWPLKDTNDPILIRKNVFWGAVLRRTGCTRRSATASSVQPNRWNKLSRAVSSLAPKGCAMPWTLCAERARPWAADSCPGITTSPGPMAPAAT